MTTGPALSERTRRRTLGMLAGLGAWPVVTGAASAGASLPDRPVCVLAPAMTEGPFFVDARLDRADLTGGSPDPAVRDALPLRLEIVFVDVRAACAPMPGLQVDVWHTDAMGRYSGVLDQRGTTWCRGHQTTAADGRVAFRTIYPGWYPGRTIHIHVKARRYDAARRVTLEFTTQIFFDDVLNDAVMARMPYAARRPRSTRNAGDGIYGDATRLLARAALDGRDAPAAQAGIVLGLDRTG